MSDAVIDTLDIAILGAVLVGSGIYWFKDKLLALSSRTSSSKLPLVPLQKPNAPALKINKVAKKTRDFVQKMKETDKTIIFFYGSQTGTSEDYAARLAKEGTQRYNLKTMTADLEDYDMNLLDTLPSDHLAVFVLATYGEGEPTDNAVEFWEHMVAGEDVPEFSVGDYEDAEKPLTNVHYVMFGLGNKTYEHYNSVCRRVDEKLLKLGATRIAERGEGDDDGSLEEDFLSWKDDMWKAVCDFLGIDFLAGNSGPRQATYKIQEHTAEEVEELKKIYYGEHQEPKFMLGSRPTYDSKNPYAAPISASRDLFSATADRHCLHMEVDVAGSGITYQAVPTTYRTIFRNYIDITAPPSRAFIGQLTPFAPTEEANKTLALWGQDKEAFRINVADARRSLGTVLEKILGAGQTMEIPFDLLIESVPRLQTRYYSISSSAKAHPTSIHLTAVILNYKPDVAPDEIVYGLATNFLHNCHAHINKAGAIEPKYEITGPKGTYLLGENGIKVPVHVRHSNFKLPRNSALPIVMIGPGTGVAPFRGFVQDRAHDVKNGKKVGATVLFFGCRREEEDYLYKDEWPELMKDIEGAQIITALSRQPGQPKTYVQHRMNEYKELIWDLIHKQGGYFYVCGDAKNMAREVNHKLIEIAMTCGEMSEEKATTYVKELRGRGRYEEDVWS
ncbi:NADPH-cytochrome P450 reductase [Modicella reniformis]|uniref:NADPH--cytochrome P450 reductase n=1 Tax=Modicella reniformis TaxID=1440133 RepID=A0A9P6IYK6_9FUNG|nr:NADPH-cytochrome P450 reductase [Modicella reniformis]